MGNSEVMRQMVDGVKADVPVVTVAKRLPIELQEQILREVEELTDDELTNYISLISSSKLEEHQGRVPALQCSDLPAHSAIRS